MDTWIPSGTVTLEWKHLWALHRATAHLMVGSVCVHRLLSRRNRMGRGMIILAVSDVAGYISDRLGFHHAGSGLSDVRTETN